MDFDNEAIERQSRLAALLHYPSDRLCCTILLTCGFMFVSQRVRRIVQQSPWDMRLQAAQDAKDEWQRQHSEVGKQIDGLLDRIVDASNPAVISAYEQRIAKLERERLVLAERVAQSVPPKRRLEDCIELALKFLSTPWSIYEKGNFVVRQTVLRLAFAEPLRYGKNGVYGTPELSLPFKALEGFSGPKNEMVL